MLLLSPLTKSCLQIAGFLLLWFMASGGEAQTVQADTCKRGLQISAQMNKQVNRPKESLEKKPAAKTKHKQQHKKANWHMDQVFLFKQQSVSRL